MKNIRIECNEDFLFHFKNPPVNRASPFVVCRLENNCFLSSQADIRKLYLYKFNMTGLNKDAYVCCFETVSKTISHL